MSDSQPETMTPDEPDTPAGAQQRRATLSELALGGALLVGETVSARLPAVDEMAAPPRTLDTVLRPVAEWDDEATPLATARRVAVGALSDARVGVGRGRRFVRDAADTAAVTTERLTRSIRRSGVLRPVRVRFHRFERRGEQQLARWEAMGRREEERSRAVAEASFGGLVQRSVSDLTGSEQVQVLIQQVVEQQSTGLLEEMVEEFRERMVSLDILLDRRTRRATPPAPSFRRVYLRARPPLAAVPHADMTLAGHYAGFVSRTAAFTIDIVLLTIALSLATTFANALVGLFNLETLLGRFMTADTFTGTLTAAIAGLTGALFVAVYAVVAWSINGQTLGDLFLGLRVVRADGRRLSFGRAFMRLVGAYVSGLVLMIGFLWALFDPRRQGWHDKLAGTVVVYDWPAVPDEAFLREAVGVRGVMPRQQPSNDLPEDL